jgi:hypothetical protein
VLGLSTELTVAPPGSTTVVVTVTDADAAD